MKWYKIFAIFKKQLKDTLKNKETLIQFIMFPVIALIMENAITIDNMPANYFVKLFGTMYVGMTPLICMASIIAEEKEKNTLRVLMMSNVKSVEYLLGVGSYVLLLCTAGSVVFGIVGGYKGMEFAEFILIMMAGVITSILIGAAVGVWSRNQMSATSLTVPIMMIFAFMPMIAAFNKSVYSVSKILYSQQINNLINGIGNLTLSAENILVIGINIILVISFFVVAYRRCGLA